MSPRGGKREGAGRKSPEPARDHLHIRVSPERKAAYAEAAARAGKPLSECVIEQLDTWAAKK